jgi:hypothetical protein
MCRTTPGRASPSTGNDENVRQRHHSDSEIGGILSKKSDLRFAAIDFKLDKTDCSVRSDGFVQRFFGRRRDPSLDWPCHCEGMQ